MLDTPENNKSIRSLKTIILYSAGHLGSAVILNRLLDDKKIELTGIIKAKPLPFTFRGARKLKKQLRRTGWRFGWLLFWQQLIQGLVFLISRLLPINADLKPGWIIARDFGIPVFHCSSVNSERCREFIKSLSPDLIISAYFNQILKPDIISIPKIGALNIHPGWLPAYRGAMCYFWILKNGEDRGGVTVHWIDEGIDTGAILARKSFLLKPGMTQQRVLVLTAIIGSHLLKKIVKLLSEGNHPNPLPDEEKDESYFPMPSGKDFQAYFAQRRYFRIRDIFGFLMREKI